MFTAKEAFNETKINQEILTEFYIKKDSKFIDKWIRKNIRLGNYDVKISCDRLYCKTSYSRQQLIKTYEARGFKVTYNYYSSYDGTPYISFHWGQIEE